MKRRNFVALIDLSAYEDYTEGEVTRALYSLLNSNASCLEASHVDVREALV